MNSSKVFSADNPRVHAGIRTRAASRSMKRGTLSKAHADENCRSRAQGRVAPNCMPLCEAPIYAALSKCTRIRATCACSVKGVRAMTSCVETVRVCFECAGDSPRGRRSQRLIRIARARGEDTSLLSMIENFRDRSSVALKCASMLLVISKRLAGELFRDSLAN